MRKNRGTVSTPRPSPAVSKARITALLPVICLLLAGACGRHDRDAVQGEKGALYFYHLGAGKQKEGDFEGAVALYEKALVLDPTLAEAHLDIGIIYDDYLLDKEAAVSHYRDYLTIQPGSEKAEMVKRWIQKAEEEKAEGAGQRGAANLSAASAGAAEARSEVARMSEELAKIKAENVAYLKTVSVLREELGLAKDEIARMLSGPKEGAPARERRKGDEQKLRAVASSLEREKTELWNRYRDEKGHLEKTIRRLKKDFENLKARKEENERALKKTRAELAGVKKRPPPPDGGMTKALAETRERNVILERKLRFYIKDNEALQERSRKMEKSLAAYRARVHVLESKPKPAPAAPTAPPPHLLAKVKADAQREKRELIQAYEKKLLEIKAAYERDKGASEKKLADSRREAAQWREQAEKLKEKAARAEMSGNSSVAKLRERYRKEKSEMERRFLREKEILASKLEEAQRMARPGKSPAPSRNPAVFRTPRPAPPQPSRPSRRRTRPPRILRRYSVGKGDTLSSIAARYYGSGSDWRKIYDANRQTLSSPHSLVEGQVLVIP